MESSDSTVQNTMTSQGQEFLDSTTEHSSHLKESIDLSLVKKENKDSDSESDVTELVKTNGLRDLPQENFNQVTEEIVKSKEKDGDELENQFDAVKPSVDGKICEIIEDSGFKSNFLPVNSSNTDCKPMADDTEVVVQAMEAAATYRNKEDSTDSSSSSDESDTDENDSEPALALSEEDEHHSKNLKSNGTKKKVSTTHEIKTKGEINPEDLPPLEDLKITIDPSVDMVPVGKVKSIVGVLAIIQANLDVPPLNTDTILFSKGPAIFERIFEVFGPVSSPWYSVRFNNEEDMKNKGIELEMDVFCAPTHKDYTNYVFVEHLKRLKGSDASWKDDNEPPQQHLDYSDDEEERMRKKGKKNKSKNDDDEEEEDDDGNVLPGALKRTKFKKSPNINSEHHSGSNSSSKKQLKQFKNNRGFNPFASRPGREDGFYGQSSGGRGHGNRSRGARSSHQASPQWDNSAMSNSNMWQGPTESFRPHLTDNRFIQNHNSGNGYMNGQDCTPNVPLNMSDMGYHAPGVRVRGHCNPPFGNSSFLQQNMCSPCPRPTQMQVHQGMGYNNGNLCWEAPRMTSFQSGQHPGQYWNRPQRPMFGGNPQFYPPPN